MAITQLYAVTETVSGTEWSFTTDTSGPDVDTTDGVFQFFLDLNALVAGDQFQIRVYEKISGSGDTQRVVYESIVTGVQSQPIWVCPALTLLHGWDFTVKKLTGTDRSIIGSVRQIS
jgi:hypothetical protein